MTNPVKILEQAENGRVMEVSFKDRRFKTPTRVVTHRELERFSDLVAEHISREKLPSVDSPPCEVQETVLDFSDNDIRDLISRNEAVRGRIYSISRRNKNGNGRLRMCNILLRNQSEVISPRAIKLLTTMQIESHGLDMVTVPDPNYTHSDSDLLLDAIDTAQKVLTNYGHNQTPIMPWLDLATQPSALRIRLHSLLDLGYRSIAFRYRPYAHASMAEVADMMADQDVWMHLSSVQKTISSHPIIPQIHVMPFYSFDTFSSYKYPSGARRGTESEEPLALVPDRLDPGGGRGGVGRSDGGEKVIPIQDAIRRLETETRFDSSALGFLTRHQHQELVGDSLNCSCFICRGMDINRFHREYGIDNGKPAPTKLHLHQEIHEIYASHSEFQAVQTCLKNESYVDYLWEKPAIQRYATKIPAIDGQSRLDRFI